MIKSAIDSDSSVATMSLMKATNTEIPCDWQIVKVGQTSLLDESYKKEKGIKEIGVYYLIDVNLHGHICSFTPVYEAWPMCAYVVFHTDEQAEADQGETEMECLNSEELCSYYETKIADKPENRRPLSNYIKIEPQEEGETDEAYRRRIAEDAREYFAGNPCGF